MYAAIFAARNGHEVELFEKNEKLGKKIYITGKGRCNLTNACDTQEIFDNIPRNEKFLYSAIYTHNNQQTMDFFKDEGLALKVERGNRVFPVSDRSSDVITTLQRTLRKAKVQVHLNTKVEDVLCTDGKVYGILAQGKQHEADAVIIATGGCSYQATGSTGDGYLWAEKMGHRIEEQVPSLVPMCIKEEYCRELQGLSLRNVAIKICKERKVLYEDFGEMLFTHFGVSGPMILSASSVINSQLQQEELALMIDLKPALTEEQLDARILRDFEDNKKKQYKNSLNKLLPSKLIPVVVELTGIDPEKKIPEITKEERQKLRHMIKRFPLTITGVRGFNEAIITRGGVSTKDVDPSTMESKVVKGLYFAGEVLDVDAYTGGFNLQIAWSTGYLAGCSIES